MRNHFIIAMLVAVAACSNGNQTQSRLAHYDLGKFEKYVMPDVLREISGIAFSGSNYDTIYAEQDNEGRLFHFKLGDKQIISSKFEKKGDYEDVAIFKQVVIMLRSDGVLFTFPLGEANNKEAAGTQEWKNLLPGGEYEAMYVNQQTGLLYVLCKQCSDDKKSGSASGYLFNVSPEGGINAAGNFSLDLSGIENITGQKKIKFRPSALSFNKMTGEWYILSSVNGMIVVTDEKWNVKQVVSLRRSNFVQPEGITFDKQGNLYISNEAGISSPGNILKFNYQK